MQQDLVLKLMVERSSETIVEPSMEQVISIEAGRSMILYDATFYHSIQGQSLAKLSSSNEASFSSDWIFARTSSARFL